MFYNFIIQLQYEDIEDHARRIGGMSEQSYDLLKRSLLCLRMMDDGVWRGRGADKYRDDLELEAIPSLRKLTEALAELRWGLLRAVDMMREAEQECAQMFEGDPLPPSPVYGNGFTGRDGRIILPDLRLPNLLSGHNGIILRPDWFVDIGETDGSTSGARDADTVLITDSAGGGMLDSVIQTSEAAGGAPVTGFFAAPAPSDAPTGSGGSNLPESSSRPAQFGGAMTAGAVARLIDEMSMRPPDATLILPHWNPPLSAAALAALSGAGFDIFRFTIMGLGAGGVLVPLGAPQIALMMTTLLNPGLRAPFVNMIEAAQTVSDSLGALRRVVGQILQGLFQVG